MSSQNDDYQCVLEIEVEKSYYTTSSQNDDYQCVLEIEVEKSYWRMIWTNDLSGKPVLELKFGFAMSTFSHDAACENRLFDSAIGGGSKVNRKNSLHSSYL